MKTYTSIKRVQAEPMTRFDAQKLGLIRDEKPVDEDGYRVVYSDNYVSWSPKKVFDDGYVELDQVEAG